jgi:hypothetical protein
MSCFRLLALFMTGRVVAAIHAREIMLDKLGRLSWRNDSIHAF